MAQELVDTLINTGGGVGGGGLLGFLMSKYIGNKTDKEIEDLKVTFEKKINSVIETVAKNTEKIEKNQEFDSLRDTAIELLKSEMINHKESNAEIKKELKEFNTKLDEIMRLLLTNINNK